MTLPEAVEQLLSYGEFAALAVLFFSSIVEYIFPPFPGDTITLAGAILAQVGQWNLALVFTVLTAGAVVGSWADYLVGRYALGRNRLLASKRGQKHGAALERILDGYKRWGPAFLMVNRFLPGIRAFFFVAAGMSGMRLGPVLFFSTISAMLWNGLIVGVGLLVGDNLDLVESIFHTYTSVVWVLLGAALLGAAIFWLRRSA